MRAALVPFAPMAESPDYPDADDVELLRARRFLRGNTTGVICFAEHIRPVFYVLDASGHPVCPVSAAMMLAGDTVLRVPDESSEAMSILVTLEDIPLASASGDRWRIYHSAPEETYFARLYLEAAKFRGFVIDGDALAQPNLLHDVEPALCKALNALSRDRLIALARSIASADMTNPLVVGVDHFGVDMRGAFGITRLEFPEPMLDRAGLRAYLKTHGIDLPA